MSGVSYVMTYRKNVKITFTRIVLCRKQFQSNCVGLKDLEGVKNMRLQTSHTYILIFVNKKKNTDIAKKINQNFITFSL